MIFDKLENISKYNLNLEFVLQDLKTQDFAKGKFNICEPQFFGIGLEYTTQPANKALWEAHRKYLDIHVILEGEELIQIADIKSMDEDSAYEDDFQLFKGNPGQTIHMREGYFLVLFPNEVHKTSIQTTKISFVRKKVFKVLING